MAKFGATVLADDGRTKLPTTVLVVVSMMKNVLMLLLLPDATVPVNVKLPPARTPV
jgi:hypothetical protein